MDDAPAVDGDSPVEGPFGGSDWDTAARVVRLLEVVQQFAVLEFADVAPVGDSGDDLDALAAGINMLGEELAGWNEDFHERVAQRTAQLNASVQQLQRFNEQIRTLTRMSNRLQIASDTDEALDALGRFAPEIFVDASGAIYAHTRSQKQVDVAATWGRQRERLPSGISSEDCCALRYGQMRDGHGRDTDCCEHLEPRPPRRSLCVPLVVRGVTLGLLSVHEDTDPSEQPADPAAPGSSAGPAANERLALAASEQFALAVTNLELRNELHAQSIRDALTGLYNRRYLDETLARELRRADRTGTPVSVLMLDIDHFKSFNDTHGHAAGDAVLAGIAAVLLGSTRSEDVACRYGGEEFTVIMAGLGEAEAVERAEQIRERIALHDFRWNEQPLGHLTASIGVATSPEHAGTTEQLLNAADTALYRAKSNGRNQVRAAS